MTRRLTTIFLIVTFAVLLVFEIPLALSFGDREQERFVSMVSGDATALASLYEDALEFDQPLNPIHAENYRLSTGARVIVMDSSGISLLDTDNVISRDYSTRPEVVEALLGHRADGVRYSNTLGLELLYVSTPVTSGGTVHGAVRITLSNSEVTAQVQQYWLGLVAIGLVVLLVIGGLGWVLARSITKPVLRLEGAANELSAGNLGRRVELDNAPPELKSLGRTFNVMADRLEEMIVTQRAFVADASHQLRTPLTALRLRIENLEYLLGEQHQGQLEPVFEEITRLTTLVEQLLELSKVERGIEEHEVDLVEMANRRVDTWSAVADEHGVTLQTVAQDSSLAVLASETAIDQILDNLLDNAVGVVPSGSTVTVSVQSGQDMHRLVVTDQGPGLSDADKERAVGRFWSGSQTRSGSGLGLSIVRSLAEGHGGSLVLRDAPESGLEVVVSFPAVKQ